jgi:predicted dinucleotide-binding enzyme
MRVRRLRAAVLEQPNRTLALQGSDIVVLAVPYSTAGAAVATEMAGLVDDKIVIDATDPLAPDYGSLVTNGTSAAESFQAQLPEAKVVKAFNSIFASHLADPDLDVEAFVTADDKAAKRVVLALVGSLGFRALDVGPLSFARYLEGWRS